MSVKEISINANDLIDRLLAPDLVARMAILDSCGVNHLGSHILIAGIDAVETTELSNDDPSETLRLLDDQLSSEHAVIFTISYDFGRKLIGDRGTKSSPEPDVFIAQFDTVIVHDYDTGVTFISGNPDKFDSILGDLKTGCSLNGLNSESRSEVISDLSKDEYLAAIEIIKENIREGNTYQTNLTQKLTAELPAELTPEIIFQRLRNDHAAPFAAFIPRRDSTVVSASPERFFKVERNSETQTRRITTSPIKGTRPRGKTKKEDESLRLDLLSSPKDRAENTMIVDLLRNDLGRVCEYGSVKVEKLCEVEEHPTLFHLVSTVSGTLRDETKPSDILNALFPCGSITGAPKISTMSIIDEIEPSDRGLSMGAIGCYIPPGTFGLSEMLDLNVAIRTMVIRGSTATFNVGGGIVIDSDSQSEYDESLTKAKALLTAINGNKF